MSYQYLIQKDKVKWSIITFLGGIVLSLTLFLIIKELSIKWALLCIIGIFLLYFPAITRNVKRFFLAALLFSLMLNLDISFLRTGHVGGVDGIMLSFFDISLFFLYFLWLSEIVRKKNTRINFFPKISIPTLFLFVIAYLSMINAPVKKLCLFEIIEIFKMYLGFFYLANHIKQEKDVNFVISCLLIGLFLEGILGLAQFSTGKTYLPSGMGYSNRMVRYRSNYRVSGTWTSYNDFAWYLTFMIPISLSISFSMTETKYKLIAASIFIVGMGGLLSTLSRAGYVSIVMSMLIVLLLNFRKIKGKTSFYNFSSSAILITFIILIIFAMNPGLLKVSSNRMFVDDDHGSAESRIPQFKVAYSIIKSNPFLGIGINNYTEVVSDYDTTEEGLSSITRFQVHNIFLQIGGEMGIIGLVIFLWLIIAIYREGLHYIKLNQGLMINMDIGLLGGITAFLIHGLFDAASIGSKLFIFLWIFAGIISGINKINSYKARQQKVLGENLT